jgi:hypothetical protein
MARQQPESVHEDDKRFDEAARWLVEQTDPAFTSEDRKQMVAWLDADPEHRRVYEDIIAAANLYRFVGEKMRDRGLEYIKKLFPVRWAIYDHPQAHPDHWGVQMFCGPWTDPHTHLFDKQEDARAHIVGQGGVVEAAPSEPGDPEFWIQGK